MGLTAERVQQILSWKGRIKTGVPANPPTPTEVRLALDRKLLSNTAPTTSHPPAGG